MKGTLFSLYHSRIDVKLRDQEIFFSFFFTISTYLKSCLLVSMETYFSFNGDDMLGSARYYTDDYSDGIQFIEKLFSPI